MLATSKADLHCRSSASSGPEEVYALAKARGMDFVTIADRDSIDAVLAIADRPDVFMSVELSARVRDSEQTVQVCCHGVSAFDHAWLQRHKHDVEVCLAFLREHSIAFSLGRCSTGAYTETPRCETPWEFLTHVRRSAILGTRCGELRSSLGQSSPPQGSVPPLRWGRAA